MIKIELLTRKRKSRNRVMILILLILFPLLFMSYLVKKWTNIFLFDICILTILGIIVTIFFFQAIKNFFEKEYLVITSEDYRVIINSKVNRKKIIQESQIEVVGNFVVNIESSECIEIRRKEALNLNKSEKFTVDIIYKKTSLLDSSLDEIMSILNII